MKKIAIFLATVFSIATVANAGDDITVTGDIDPVTINNAWSLIIKSYRLDGTGAITKTYDAVTEAGFIGFGGDNAYFTDPANITLTPAEIPSVDINGDPILDGDGNPVMITNPAYVEGRYDTIAHRAAPEYTRLDFQVLNNESDTFSVKATFNSNYLDIPVPAGAAVGESVMHLTTGYEYYADGSPITITTNLQNSGIAQPALNGTANAITLYKDEAGNGLVSDLFRAYVALDFLPTVIPAGTYSGSVDWTLSESIS